LPLSDRLKQSGKQPGLVRGVLRRMNPEGCPAITAVSMGVRDALRACKLFAWIVWH
jgi:hypothetical protein